MTSNLLKNAALSPSELGFDPDALRRKYREERDKRIRADGNGQYQEISGEFARYLDDPYVAPGLTRAPLTDEVDVVVIGGGFGGLLCGARLREAGVERIRIIEQGGDFGGTWYWNRYPGAACDTEAYIYLPLLEETGYMPSHKFAFAPEIREHCSRIGRHFDLYRDACFQTAITGVQWDEESRVWVVHTNRDDRIRARYVVMANGPLHRPKLPGIPGIRDFKGHTFHTSRWDYAYTGGSSEGKLTGLAGKRVGILGTGATAVQCVPHLAAGAGHLYVFQRTPSSIDVRNNHPTDAEWFGAQKPGWQRERMENFNVLTSGGIAEVDLVKDGWTEIIRLLLAISKNDRDALGSPEKVAAAIEIADFTKMNQVRARVDAIVQDKATAQALKPWYRQFCKRPCFHDGYLPTFNRPNVTLVDTQGLGVDGMTERGMIVGGKEYELDCLVFATGFEVGTDYTRRSGYDLTGRGGVKLSQKWAGGMRTLHGIMTADFPNLFIVSNAQSGFTTNFPHGMDEQSRHLTWLITQARQRGAVTVEPTAQAEEDWVQACIGASRMNEAYFEECTPGYYNNEGNTSGRNRQNVPWGRGPLSFYKLLAKWREEGDLQGMDLRR